MAGAEDEARNEVIVNFLNENYGDIATSFYLTSDSLMSLKTAFDSGTCTFFIFEDIRNFLHSKNI